VISAAPREGLAVDDWGTGSTGTGPWGDL